MNGRRARRGRITGKRGGAGLRPCPRCGAALPAIAGSSPHLVCGGCGYGEPLKNAGLATSLPPSGYFQDPDDAALAPQPRRRRR